MFRHSIFLLGIVIVLCEFGDDLVAPFFEHFPAREDYVRAAKVIAWFECAVAFCLTYARPEYCLEAFAVTFPIAFE